MRVVLQRVKEAKLFIDREIYSSIDRGLLAFVCVCRDDTEEDLYYIAKKMVNMRIFSDSSGKFNLSLRDIEGECMIVSQFTLAADIKKGNRPSYFYAQNPPEAKNMYDRLIEIVKDMKIDTEHGIFAADMQIELINDGPVTIYIDSKNRAG